MNELARRIDGWLDKCETIRSAKEGRFCQRESERGEREESPYQAATLQQYIFFKKCFFSSELKIYIYKTEFRRHSVRSEPWWRYAARAVEKREAALKESLFSAEIDMFEIHGVRLVSLRELT